MPVLRRAASATVVVCLALPATAAQAIVGGRPATPQDNPSMVGLAVHGESISDPGNPFCGGSLIAPQVVLTAAHCLEEFGAGTQYASRMDVVGGAISRSDPGMQRVRVSEVLRHPAYERGRTLHDMVILRLAAPIFAPTIRLAGAGDGGLNAPGAQLRATGWGLRRNNSEDQPDTLKYADIPVIAASRCRSLYGASVFVDRYEICAAQPGGTPDTCQGDSGGPLFGGDPLTLVGIVSYGPSRCAVKGEAAVYARVSSERAWIDPTAGLTGDPTAPAQATPTAPPVARNTVRTRIGAISCDDDTCHVTVRASGSGRPDISDVTLRVDRKRQRDYPQARRLVRARKVGPGVYRARTLLPLGTIRLTATPYAADGARLGRPATEEIDVSY